jgi:hypothetical protein
VSWCVAWLRSGISKLLLQMAMAAIWISPCTSGLNLADLGNVTQGFREVDRSGLDGIRILERPSLVSMTDTVGQEAFGRHFAEGMSQRQV